MRHYKNGGLAEVPADNWPAYLQHWVSALERQELQLAEIQMLSPGKLAEWLTLCVSKDKESAVSYGTQIVILLLSLKYASDEDFQTDAKHWLNEVCVTHSCQPAACILFRREV